MERDGLISLGRGHRIDLTPAGQELAESIIRRHMLAERLLTDILKLDWADVHGEAHRMEHAISPLIEKQILRLLDNPTTCPHGNPIPGSGYTERDLITLSTLSVGDEFTITRIPEELEFTPGLLDFLEDNDILPGRRGTVDAASPDGTLTVTIADHTVGIGSFAGARILVTAA